VTARTRRDIPVLLDNTHSYSQALMRTTFRSQLLVALLAALFSLPAIASEKLIALTFDDGPRPYVLFGMKEPQATPGLLALLDRNQVKATFFAMGWRLTPKTWGEPRAETNIGMTCIDAAKQVLKDGHEIENHTFSHIDLRIGAKKKGDAWALEDVDHGAQVIGAVTGSRPKYLRPPDWDLTPELRKQIESQGFRVMTISSENPIAVRDINTLDYLCAGKHPTQCPKPSLAQAVLKQIDARERQGVYTDILTFHELTTTTAALDEVITSLKARGYRFVRLDEYMQRVR
jgi:peptidoglycan/xylan/chitin deacetylase (PgdA/CDA1 family)